MKTCADCKHFTPTVQTPDGPAGLCKRYPPTTLMIPNPGQSGPLVRAGVPQMGIIPASFRPQVLGTDGCGEFGTLVH